MYGGLLSVVVMQLGVDGAGEVEQRGRAHRHYLKWLSRAFGASDQ